MLLFLRSTSMQKHKINRSRHAAFLLHVHLVFVTKYRRKILGESHYAAFHQYAAEVSVILVQNLKKVTETSIMSTC